jgi:hypothetical protein
LPAWAQLAWRVLALAPAAVLLVAGLLCRIDGDRPDPPPPPPLALRGCDAVLLASAYWLLSALSGSARMLGLAALSTAWAFASEVVGAGMLAYDLCAAASIATALAILYLHFWESSGAEDEGPPRPDSPGSAGAEEEEEPLLLSGPVRVLRGRPRSPVAEDDGYRPLSGGPAGPEGEEGDEESEGGRAAA